MATKKEKGAIKVKKVEKKVAVKMVKEVKAPKYELVTFSVKATIPTQQYGNIMPEIVVKAKTIEEAKAIVLPMIESLYVQYCEKPRDGGSVSFMSRSSVTVEEKKVDVPKPEPKAPEIKKETGPMSADRQNTMTPDPAAKVTAPAESVEDLANDLNDRSPAFIKASKAISSCKSKDALDLIEGQIQKSVKLTPEEKPLLLTELLKKGKEFA